MYPLLVGAVIDNMSLSNREELKAKLVETQQPNPEAQQAQQQQMEMQMAQIQAQIQLLQSQSMESQSRANKYTVEAELEPKVVEAKLAAALSSNLQSGTADDKEFERRAKIADLLIKEEDIQSNERIAQMQMASKNNLTKQ